jgi:death-on-curing protein
VKWSEDDGWGDGEPVPPWQTVDEGKLESALQTPRYVLFGEEMYPSMPEKAAVLLYAMAKAHGLPNGNKRMALMSTLFFLGVNGLWLMANSEEVRAHVTWIAASEARLRDHVLAYVVPYIESRLIPFDQAASERGINVPIFGV